VLLPVLWINGAAAAGIDDTYTKASGTVSILPETVARFFGRTSRGKSYALVIGVGAYDHFPPLSAPATDAFKVRDFLRDEAGFDLIVTLTDEKATRGRVEDLLERFFPNTVGQNDDFLFYFSGHGVTRNLASAKRGYLVLKQAERGEWQKMIDMPRVRQWIENLGQARHTLFILDACFGGLAAYEPKGDVREKTIERLMQPGHHIITAGTEGEQSYIYRGESLFTQAFLSAARGEGTSASDGIVSLGEIMIHINRILDAKQAEFGNLKMTPHQYYSRIENNSGEFFFLPWKRPESAVANLPPTATSLATQRIVKGGSTATTQEALPPLAPAIVAPPAALTRVRGTIEKVDGKTLTVKSREGATVTVKLKDDALVTGVEAAKLADIKQNSFVGITAMPQPDGTQKAIEVHIFPEARRGAGEGHRPWDLVSNSTMTNANVEQLVASVDGPMLTMKYKDGEKKISVPNNAIIVLFVNGDKSELKPGAKIFIAAGTKLPNGDIEAAGINVGRGGLTPPM